MPLRGRRGGAVVVHSDITDRKRSHDELEFRATRDDLTGLLNRHALEAETDAALARARARGSVVAVLFVDLDGFKPINDQYGHAVGDEVLRAVARRLSTAVRTTDRVARFGGDEFVVLVGPLDEPVVAEQTAERILRAFDLPVRVDQLEIPVAVSIGVAVVDGAGAVSREGLIEAADEAMYRAKQGGGGRAVLAR
jgi:diguanylate cyclase (GGDEF)-like protein